MIDYLDKIIQGDAIEILRTLPDGLVHTCVTSPPYWGLRDYGVEGQLGLEATPEEYVGRLLEMFREVWRVLRDDGTLWLVLGDSYVSAPPGNTKPRTRSKTESGVFQIPSQLHYEYRKKGHKDKTKCGLKTKDLIGIPWRIAFALQADGWWLRSDIIWSKSNPMPESVNDRPTKAHEYIFLLSKSVRYYYDQDAIKEFAPTKRYGGRQSKGRLDSKAWKNDGKVNRDSTKNKRSVWMVPTVSCPDAHFAVYPPALIRPCVLAGCPQGGIVLDPFFGRGTTGRVALEYGRHFIGIELNEEYVKMAERYLASFRQQVVLTLEMEV